MMLKTPAAFIDRIHDKWSELMNPLMEFRPDGIVASSEVREVFHLQTRAGQGAHGPAPRPGGD